MDATKPAGMRGIVSLAYDNRPSPSWKKREKSGVPGPLFDVFLGGIFLIALICYLA